MRLEDAIEIGGKGSLHGDGQARKTALLAVSGARGRPRAFRQSKTKPSDFLMMTLLYSSANA